MHTINTHIKKKSLQLYMCICYLNNCNKYGYFLGECCKLKSSQRLGNHDANSWYRICTMDDPHSGKTAILLSGAVGFESTPSMHTLHSISSLRFNATRKFYFVSSHMISNAPLFHLPWRNNHNNVMLEFFEKKSFSFFFHFRIFIALKKVL